MATVHFLEQSNGVVHVVVHQAVPSGSNAAGVTWKNVILGAGLNTSKMTTGTLGGQITSTELATITAGDVVEIDLRVPIFSGGSTAGQINALITQAVNNWKADFQGKYNYFGREI